MTKEELYNLGPGEYVIPSDVNDQFEGAYIILGKVDNKYIAVKTAYISESNMKMWDVVYSEGSLTQ